MIQEQIEQLFSKQNRKRIILSSLTEDQWFNDAVCKSIYILQEHLQKPNKSEEKTERLQEMWKAFQDVDDLTKLIENIYVATVQLREVIPLVSLAAQLAGQLEMFDKPTAIKSMAEILVVLSETDLFSVVSTKNGQPAIRNNVTLDEDLLHEVNRLMYLPPMISKPKVVSKNRDSYHYSLNPESLILGGRLNHHKEDISLDVLNTLSQQALSLDQDFISQVKPTRPNGMKQRDWDLFIGQLNYVNQTIGTNDIYIPYKVDKRGRVYACGYHVNSQGSDYHKAVIELANKVLIEVD